MRGKALRLLKGLYSLKQVARIWLETFAIAIKKIGFKSISSDKYIFIEVAGGELVIIALYIDDILIFIKTLSTVNRVKD